MTLSAWDLGPQPGEIFRKAIPDAPRTTIVKARELQRAECHQRNRNIIRVFQDAVVCIDGNTAPHISISMHINAYQCIQCISYIHTYVRTYVHTYRHTYIHLCMFAFMYVRVYIHIFHASSCIIGFRLYYIFVYIDIYILYIY